jgi:membrane protease YdiL (CAAX protease family)
MMHDTTLAAIFWIPGLFASALIGKKRKLLFQTRFLLLLLLVGGVFGGLTGCGTSSYTAIPQAVQTTPFQVMVTGTGNVTQTISLTVTVQ